MENVQRWELNLLSGDRDFREKQVKVSEKKKGLSMWERDWGITKEGKGEKKKAIDIETKADVSPYSILLFCGLDYTYVNSSGEKNLPDTLSVLLHI